MAPGMNIQLRSPNLPRTSQAAEGLERRRWSVAEIEAMVEAGVIEEDERFELIGGEIVPMSPKGIRHEVLKMELLEHWVPKKPKSIKLIPETTFRLNEDTFLEPDFVFFSADTGVKNLNGDTALLAVELSDSSLGYDLGRKARLYATFNIRELWVIDAVKLVTHVHRSPGVDGYREKSAIPPDQLVVPAFAPELAIRLSSLPLL
jgi:Uma2 family endonuclease